MFGHLSQWVGSNFVSEVLPNNGNFMQCHLIHQADFPCKRKLLFDNIEGYFDDLTEKNSSNLTLRNVNIAPTHIRILKACSALTFNELDIQEKNLITDHYGEDLVLYNE